MTPAAASKPRPADPNHPPDPEEALLDQLNALANIVESVVWIHEPMPPDEHNLGMGAETEEQGPGFEGQDFLDALEMTLMRVTVCPGDYNRDGCVNLNPGGDDWLLFHAALSAGHPYADWNFDRDHTSVDSEKFAAGWSEVDCAPCSP